MLKLIIFDFDGVIITGSNEAYFYCYHKALETVNVHLPPKEEKENILKHWGKGYRYQLKCLLIDYPQLLEEAIKSYEKNYQSEFIKRIKLIKGADTALNVLSQKYNLAIASGMMRKTLNYLLEEFNFSNLFKEIISSEDVITLEDRKPSPYMLNKIVDDFRFNKSVVVYVGDAENDVIMARNAGITPIAVLTGHLNREQAEKLGVKNIISDITHLPEELRKL